MALQIDFMVISISNNILGLAVTTIVQKLSFDKAFDHRNYL